MKTPLNSPLEAGLRVLIILTEAFPAAHDINRLVLLDHSVLNTSDLGGPDSLQPRLPIRSGELGVKRQVIEQGLHVMLRAGMVEMRSSVEGIRFKASESAYSFVTSLGADYAHSLRSRARWVTQHFGTLSDLELRSEMRKIYGSWAEEFASLDAGSSEGEAIDESH